MATILIEDESLRDGLQSEKTVVSLEDKVLIFDLLRSAGVRRIQVGAFVNPKVVPQMADTERLIRQVTDRTDIVVTALALNANGLARALACGLEHISLSASASNTHSMKNVRKSSREAMDSVTRLIAEANEKGVAVRTGVQCAFGCVYEGTVSEDKVIDFLGRMVEAGAGELNLADTAGMANPLLVKRLIHRVSDAFPDTALSLHLHDTRGLGLANMVAGYDAGVRIFDTSAGGLGGCPFVANAAGNVPTEDVVHLFESMGVHTHIDLKGICKVAEHYERLLGRKLPGRMSHVLKNSPDCQV